MIHRRIRLAALFVLLTVFCAYAQNSLDPSIAMSHTGRIGIVHAMSAPASRIILTVSDSVGAPTADTVVVNEGMVGRGVAVSIAAGAADDFLVVWEQNTGSSQLWCARYSSAGERRGNAVSVADSIAVNATSPRIAAGKDGRSVVAWQDYRNQVPDLQYQLFTPGLTKLGRNRLLAAYPGIPFYPVPTISTANEIAFVYQQTIKDTFHVCARIARWNKQPGKVLILDKAKNRAYSTNPDIIWSGKGELVAVWKDYRTRISDIYLQRFTRDGLLLGANVKVNDDTTILWQRLPRIAANDSLVCVVWEDYRNDPRNQMADVYCQWYRRSGIPVLHNMRVNTSNEPTNQSAPSIVMDRHGRASVVWCEGESERVTIAGRCLSIGEFGAVITSTGGVRLPLK
jgi:hypothetical protein